MDNLPVILVVEDDSLIQSVIEESLTEGGFEVVVSLSAQSALALLDASEGRYRALVTDINLGPGQAEGWDVARHAREIDPNFPVVYMSGKDAVEWASMGVPNSIMLSKPFAPAQLVTAVSQLLNNQDADAVAAVVKQSADRATAGGIRPLLALNFFMADMQAGIGPFLGCSCWRMAGRAG